MSRRTALGGVLLFTGAVAFVDGLTFVTGYLRFGRELLQVLPLATFVLPVLLPALALFVGTALVMPASTRSVRFRWLLLTLAVFAAAAVNDLLVAMAYFGAALLSYPSGDGLPSLILIGELLAPVAVVGLFALIPAGLLLLGRSRLSRARAFRYAVDLVIAAGALAAFKAVLAILNLPQVALSRRQAEAFRRQQEADGIPYFGIDSGTYWLQELATVGVALVIGVVGAVLSWVVAKRVYRRSVVPVLVVLGSAPALSLALSSMTSLLFLIGPNDPGSLELPEGVADFALALIVINVVIGGLWLALLAACSRAGFARLVPAAAVRPSNAPFSPSSVT